MLTSTSANIMPVGLLLGTMDFWHTCSCFKYTCIRLTALPTPDYPNLHLKVRENEMAGEGSSFLQIYSLSFAQLLINLSCLLFSKEKEKKSDQQTPIPIYDTWTGPGQLANS